MHSLDPSIPLTGQFECNPLVLQSHVQGCEWDPSETRVASTFVLLSPPMQEQAGFHFRGGSNQHSCHSSPYMPNSPWSGPDFPDMSLCSTSANQVDLNPVGVEDDDPFAFFEFDASFLLNIPNTAFTSPNQTQDDIQWPSGPEYDPGLVFTEDPEAVSDVIRASDEVPGHSRLSTFVPAPTSLATSLDPNLSSSSQDLETSFQPKDPYPSPSDVDVSPPDWPGSGRPVVLFFAENFPTPDPLAGICRSPYPAGSSQKVDSKAVQSSPYTARPPSEQQSILLERLVGRCEWQNGDGTICMEKLTLASLPGHLSAHGIKKKSRDWPTKCSWVGCRRKRSMNRESIVRHIREVHFGLKRSTKQAQDPCL